MKNHIIWNAKEHRPRFVWRLRGQLLIVVFTLMILDGTIAPWQTSDSICPVGGGDSWGSAFCSARD